MGFAAISLSFSFHFLNLRLYISYTTFKRFVFEHFLTQADSELICKAHIFNRLPFITGRMLRGRFCSSSLWWCLRTSNAFCIPSCFTLWACSNACPVDDIRRRFTCSVVQISRNINSQATFNSFHYRCLFRGLPLSFAPSCRAWRLILNSFINVAWQALSKLCLRCLHIDGVQGEVANLCLFILSIDHSLVSRLIPSFQTGACHSGHLRLACSQIINGFRWRQGIIKVVVFRGLSWLPFLSGTRSLRLCLNCFLACKDHITIVSLQVMLLLLEYLHLWYFLRLIHFLFELPILLVILSFALLKSECIQFAHASSLIWRGCRFLFLFCRSRYPPAIIRHTHRFDYDRARGTPWTIPHSLFVGIHDTPLNGNFLFWWAGGVRFGYLVGMLSHFRHSLSIIHGVGYDSPVRWWTIHSAFYRIKFKSE